MVSAPVPLTFFWKTEGCGEASSTKARRLGCICAHCSLVCWACYLLHSPLALKASALQIRKTFFFSDKTHSNLKGNGHLYFDYFQCIDIVLLCEPNCKTLLRYCIENTHRKKHIYTFIKIEYILAKLLVYSVLTIIEPNLHHLWRKMIHPKTF